MENQTVAQKLEALVKLQSIDSKIDQIRKLRGDLPDEVQDLEDEMEGYKTRMTRFETDLKELEDVIKKNKEGIKEAEKLVKKYNELQKNVKNNREFDAITKEVELQELETQICEKKIKEADGIDLQVLGIGNNGHIGFNEPGSGIYSKTRLITLDNSTRIANSYEFANISEVPRLAITMGISSILKSKRIILMAWGSSKAPAIKSAVEDEDNEHVPASLLFLEVGEWRYTRLFFYRSPASCLLRAILLLA